MAEQSCIAVTGADGFLGWHIRCHLHSTNLPSPRLVRQGDFSSVEALARAIGPATVLIHLAGMNRGPASEVHETNIRLAQQIVRALEMSRITPTILFANSIHSLGDGPFGNSKREASRVLSAWASVRGVQYLDVVLPHLFGEGGKPFYNSAFATFCHQLSRGDRPQVHSDVQLELVHAQRVAKSFLDLACGDHPSGVVQVSGAKMLVSETLSRLDAMDKTYRAGVIPELSDQLVLDFFNTYRSYLYSEHYPVHLQNRMDDRGCLFEAVKSHQGGQVFLSTTRPGVTRGRHYHRHKVERFLVVSGQAEIRIRRLLDEKVRVFRVTGDEPCYIDIPTLHTHEITNVGSRDLLTLFWSHQIFDLSNPDTHPEPVILES